MPIHYSKKVISSTDVEKIVALSENWIMDMKGKDIKPAKLSRTVSAFANSNGGEIYLGISHLDDKDQYFWDGYKNEESFNEYATLLENILPSFESYVIEALLFLKTIKSALNNQQVKNPSMFFTLSYTKLILL